MLYLFYGDDSAKKHGALEALGTPGSSSVFFASKGNEYEAIIDEHAGSVSLFGGLSVIVFDDVLADKENRSGILARARELAESDNLFVFLEQKALKETLTAFSGAGATVTEFLQKAKHTEHSGRTKTSAGFDANVFALTDAFARKDKKNSWVLLQQAFAAGKSPEEITGLLFWQIKNLLLVKDPRASAATLAMKPFVFSKASVAAKFWEHADLENAASALVRAAHESRRGETDAESALERVVLTAL